QIVSRLQNNECEIDELKAYTTRSLELLRYCKSRLYETDEELKKMLEELEE
ncbi:exodeoxyribonuclease VII small subunit, partial [[Clostridium] symbiosum]|nr:exodeoxyribonuclease VII small subunit [[Clostridium] symbiosum]